MGLAEELIAIKMRLQGAAAYQRGMQRSTAVTSEYGTAAERAGTQAKAGAVGINAMNASASKGIGAMAQMKKAGEGMKSTGSKLTSAFTVPIALIGGVGVKMALDFSDSMEQISTQAGASQREVGSMTKAILAYAASGESDAGPNELAKGLFSIESAGFRGKRALDALIKSEQLATVGHADFEKTSKAVAAAMATNIKGSQNLNELVGTLNSTVGVGSMRFEDLLSAMSTGLLDRAATFGLSLKEVGAALGTMTTVGQPAAASATRMAMAFNMMAAPTKKAADAMKGIGLQEQDLAMTMRKRGLASALELLKSKLDSTFGTSKRGLTEQAKALSEMFGGGRTSGGLMSLLRHIDLLHSKYGELTGVQGKFKTALERTDAQPITKLHKAWVKLQVALIEVGTMLIPVITEMAGAASDFLSGFSKLPGPVRKVAVWLAVGLAIIGPLLSMTGMMVLGATQLATGFTMLAGAMGVSLGVLGFWVVAGIALIAAWTLIIMNFKTWGKYVIAFFVGPFALAATLIASNWGKIKAVFGKGIDAVVGLAGKLPGLTLSALRAYPRVFGWIVGFWVTLPIRVGIALVKWAPIVAARGYEVLAFIKSLPGRAVSALIGFAPKMFAVGKDAITKMWNGLRSAESSINHWFSSL